MDSAVVHDNDRLGRRKGIHLQNEVLDERREALRIEGTFHNRTLDDTVERDRRKNRVPTAH